MNIIKLSIIFISLTVTSVLYAQTKPPRIKYNFNPGWKLYVGDVQGAESVNFGDNLWKDITLPHAWNEDDAFRKPIDSLTTGIAWYRKHFKISAEYAEKKIFLEFEGIRQAGEFYLNGKFIGRHENGVMAFGFDITDQVKIGSVENVLAVRIDNAWNYKEKATNSGFQWNDKNFNANYGGIHKNVWLHVTNKLYQTLPLYTPLQTTGVYVYAKDFNIKGKSATITTESQVKNNYTETKTFSYEVEIKDLEGKIVKVVNGNKTSIDAGEIKTVSASSLVNNLNFWSWGYGYLYTVITRLKINDVIVDEVQTKTGFRKTEFKNGMVYLNDRVLMMHGYGQRTSNEWPAIGASVPAWLSDYSNGLMVESNGNLVRWMHITPWKQDVESCDRVGLIQSMPAGDSEGDVQGRRWEQRLELMRDAMIYNRNNPSIMFYESGNKGVSEEHMKNMKAIRDQFDPYGGRASGSREMLSSRVAEYGGEMLYTNKSAHVPFWAMEYSRDEGLRKYWDNYTPPFHKNGDGPLHKGADASAYNRNQDTHALEDVARWYEFWKERPGTGDRVSSGGVNIVFSDSNTHFRGAENYRRSGEVDALRIAKDGFYAHQIMWNGWVMPEKTGIHIIGHWNYKPRIKKDVYVVSSGDKVELFINGTSLGFGEQTNGFQFTFKNIEWKAGLLKAVSYDDKGNKLAETQMKTAGKPIALRLTTIQNPSGGLKADGADLAIAEVEVVDAEGIRCPTALNMVNFSLEGPAEWRGGLAQGAGNFILAKSLPVECGVNRVIIRSAPKAGKITLTANSEGLKSSTVTFQSLSLKVTDGLTLEMPSDGLLSNLKRGPTPAGQSYKVTRKSVKIIGGTAGANADNLKASYDDNETSEWANDGKVSTAWVRYDLEKETIISEVELKLNNFRSRSYPIRILVDGKEAFNGDTKTSLGYFTAICKPTKGKTVTIQLKDVGSIQGDNNNAGVEISGKKLDDGVARDDKNAKGMLSIIEAEVYEKP